MVQCEDWRWPKLKCACGQANDQSSTRLWRGILEQLTRGELPLLAARAPDVFTVFQQCAAVANSCFRRNNTVGRPSPPALPPSPTVIPATRVTAQQASLRFVVRRSSSRQSSLSRRNTDPSLVRVWDSQTDGRTTVPILCTDSVTFGLWLGRSFVVHQSPTLCACAEFQSVPAEDWDIHTFRVQLQPLQAIVAVTSCTPVPAWPILVAVIRLYLLSSTATGAIIGTSRLCLRWYRGN